MRTHDDALAWVERGTAVLTAAVATLDEQTMSEPSRLPGWSRKHLIAHVAANADALGNLVHWARTGQRTRCTLRRSSAAPTSRPGPGWLPTSSRGG